MNQSLIFEAVRRGYNNLQDASDEEILNYFHDTEAEAITGHLSNIKGIVFEETYVEKLAEADIEAHLFEQTNHPLTDIFAYTDEGYQEFQLKATDNVSYINETLATLEDTPIVVTSEVAQHFDNELIIDSGISNDELTSAVASTLFEESDFASDVANEFTVSATETFVNETASATIEEVGSSITEDLAIETTRTVTSSLIDEASDDFLTEVATEVVSDSILDVINPFSISPVRIGLALLTGGFFF